MAKVIQSSGFFYSWWGNLGKKGTLHYDVLFAMFFLNAINKFERRTSGKGAARAGKRMKIQMILLES